MILRRVCAFLAVLSVAACESFVPASADADLPAGGLPAATVPDGFGVNIHFTDPQPGEAERLRAGGFGFVRMDFAWSAIEKVRGVYDFSAYDRLYGALQAIGIRPIYILDYGNDVYEKGPPRSIEARAGFARFCAAAVRHFAGKAVVWEIWNEPNGDGFWPPHNNAAEYAALAVDAARAIRAADPHCTVIAPGASGFPWEYLETVFKSGLLQYLDGVSVHPYRGASPETAALDFARLRALIARYAPENKRELPMIASEWGYSTQQGGISEERQGQYIVREWLANLASGVNLSIYYDWKEDGVSPTDPEAHFGAVRPNLTPKPAFQTARSLIQSLRGYTFRHRLVGATTAQWRLLFQKGDSGHLALVTWTTDAAAAAADQAPAVRKLTPSDPEYAPLLRLACVRFAPGPLAQSAQFPARVSVLVANPTADAARVRLSFAVLNASSRNESIVPYEPKPADITVRGKAEGLRGVPLPTRGMLRSGSAQCSLQVTWNGQPLPAVVPIDVERTDPLNVSAAPWRDRLRVAIENPSGAPFQGTLQLEGAPEEQAIPVSIAAGSTRFEAVLPLPSGNSAYRVVVKSGRPAAVVAETPRERLVALPGFTKAGDTAADFHRSSIVDNKPSGAKTPLSIGATSGDAPSAVALYFDYHFDPGWQYAEAIPGANINTIPAAAESLILWIHSDGSDNYLRSRFIDSTGQMFQPDLGALHGAGWRVATIPLNGAVSAAHWGGADDGIPHPPLRWDSLLLIDSASPQTPRSGAIQAAAPTYVFSDPAPREAIP